MARPLIYPSIGTKCLRNDRYSFSIQEGFVNHSKWTGPLYSSTSFSMISIYFKLNTKCQKNTCIKKLPQNTILRFVALGASMTYHTQLVVRQTPSSRTSILLLSPKHRRRCLRLSHIALRFFQLTFLFAQAPRGVGHYFHMSREGRLRRGRLVPLACHLFCVGVCVCAQACLGGGERSSPTVASAPTGNDAVPRAARAPEGESHDPPRAVCFRVFPPLSPGETHFLTLRVFHRVVSPLCLCLHHALVKLAPILIESFLG